MSNRFDEDIWTLEKIAERNDYELYVAFWPEENEKVLVKHIRSDLPDEKKEKVEERLLKEAATLEEFWSPYFPKIFDIRRRPQDNSLYIISEFFPGVTVKEFLERATPKELTATLYLKFTHDLKFALKYLHEKKGVLHLDLTPDNIIIDLDKNFHLIDFENSDLIGKELSREEIRGKAGYLHPDFLEKKTIILSPKHDFFALEKTLNDFYGLLSLKEKSKLLTRKLNLRPESILATLIIIIAGFYFLTHVSKSPAPTKRVVKSRVNRSPAIPKKPERMATKVIDKVIQKSSSVKKKEVRKQQRPKSFQENFISSVGAKDLELKECLKLFHHSLPDVLRLEFSIESPKNKLNALSVLEPLHLNNEAKICLRSIYKEVEFPSHQSKKSYIIVQSFKF